MKILLAIDGSSWSKAAIEEVATRAWPEASQVRVVSVVEPHAPLTSGPWGSAATKYHEEAEAAERQGAQEILERAAAFIRPRQSSNSELKLTTEILSGSPKRVIVEEAEKWGADLIVIGSHGYRSWERMLLGSVSQAVAMHAECSVEIVRRRNGKDRGQGSEVKGQSKESSC